MSSTNYKPLYKKLGIQEGFSIYILNPPRPYHSMVPDGPIDIILRKRLGKNSLDFIHGFFQTKAQLAKYSLRLKSSLTKSGMLWISWPKGKSKIDSDLNRDFIREYFLSLGLVDVKILSIDDNWSALKFVYRLKDR